MFPLAAGLSLGVGAFWWALTLRHEGVSSVALRDHGQEWMIGVETPPTLPENLPAGLQAAIVQATRTGRLSVPADLEALRDARETFATRRSARPNTFRLRSPMSTALVEDRPRFRWTPVLEATGYHLSLTARGKDQPENEATLSATIFEWSPAEALVLGATYQWKMQARRGEVVLAQAPAETETAAWFRILSIPERAAWEGERAAVGDSNFLRGIVAARAGLMEEAAAAFRALGRQNPRAEPARLFLEQVAPPSVR